MITTKKMKKGIGISCQKQSYKVIIQGDYVKADCAAKAEINAELRNKAIIQRQISAESKRLASELYAGV